MPEASGNTQKQPPANSVNNGLKGCLAVLIGLTIGIVIIIIATAICGNQEPDESPDESPNGTMLTDMEFNKVVEELTKKAIAQNWCYQRSGELDSRDMRILVFHSEDIAEQLFGAGSYIIGETRLRQHLLGMSWTEFEGPDYDRGGTEMRYRPPDCG